MIPSVSLSTSIVPIVGLSSDAKDLPQAPQEPVLDCFPQAPVFSSTLGLSFNEDKVSEVFGSTFGFSFAEAGWPHAPVLDCAFATGTLSLASQAVVFASRAAADGIFQASETGDFASSTSCASAAGALSQGSQAVFFGSSLGFSTGAAGLSQLSQAVFFGESGS